MSTHKQRMIKLGGVALVLGVVTHLFPGVAAVYCACTAGWIVCLAAWLCHFVKYRKEART